MASVLPYNLPQGISIDALKNQAVPRKIGAYDTEGFTAAAVAAQLVYFQNSNAFVNPLATYVAKVYGRDTNITSRTGGMAKGERLYGYGVSAKMDVAGADLTVVGGIAALDIFRRIWAVSWVEIRLGSDEFVSCQARDIPVFVPKALATTHGASNAMAIPGDGMGMFDITISGEPYIFDQQEDFRLNLNCVPGAVVGINVTIETHITMKLEGIRLKALRA
jgi:hypothetical protein